MNTEKFQVLAACALLSLLAGCAAKPPAVTGPVQNSRRLVTSSFDEQVALGIARQHMIYPAHFFPGTAELNELGVRDLTVLAGFLGRHPGELGVRRDQASPALYESRVQTVRAFLAERGVPVARMRFTEDWPGGDGLGAESVMIRYLDAESVGDGPSREPAGGGPIGGGPVGGPSGAK